MPHRHRPHSPRNIRLDEQRKLHRGKIDIAGSTHAAYAERIPQAPERATPMMIVYYKNGVPQVVTGWKAWLMLIAGAIAFVVIGGLMLGIALTVWTIALFALPLAILAGVLMTLLGPRR